MLQMSATLHDRLPSLRLDGDLTIYTTAQARQELAKALSRHRVIEIDLGGVAGLDPAGVQLLLWLKRTAAASGTTLVLARHSPAVVEALDLLKVSGAAG